MLPNAFINDAIAEIAARQDQLSGRAAATPTPPAPAWDARPLLGSQHDDAVERSVAAFRNELADIRATIAEALPRKAVESIESEIRALSHRIDETRAHAGEDQTLSGVERALNMIHDDLKSLRPAEQLAGFAEAIRTLNGRVDGIVRNEDDPAMVRHLEDAIATLRAIVADVASHESLGRLGQSLQGLSSRLDRVAPVDALGDTMAALEQRITALTATLEATSRDREDTPDSPSDNPAYSHLDSRVSDLMERLERGDAHRHMRIEAGLDEIKHALERQQATQPILPEPKPGMDPETVEAIRRELADMRFHQTESDRQTQNSLEVVHNTLGDVVERLSSIEGDLRQQRHAPPVQVAMAPVSVPAPVMPPPVMTPPPLPVAPVEIPVIRDEPPSRPAARASEASPKVPAKPELPNPVASAAAPPRAEKDPQSWSARFRAAAAAARIDRKAASRTPDAVLSGDSTPAGSSVRTPIAPDLPPDTPLEPGTRATTASLAETPAAGPEGSEGVAMGQTSSFIAAARRAAIAAAASTATDDAKRGTVKATAPASRESSITAKIRSLLVGASVVVIVLGSFKMVVQMLDGDQVVMVGQKDDSAAQSSDTTNSIVVPTPAATPSVTSPTPMGRQSTLVPPPSAMTPDGAAAQGSPDVTGALGPAGETSVAPASLANATLPEAIGPAKLRNAALSGDVGAAYEVGVRFAEGRGVVQSYPDAAKWYERAALAGIVPAIFRMGTLYEKGAGVTKNSESARRYYGLAADKGYAKAMHNLAVMEAEGGSGAPNFAEAARWFRKAADRGVADSQYNLGILYARGIGVEQNLAESYKWFNLAASQGDGGAVPKRDDVAKKLDAQSLAAARLAVQTFTVEAQPADALNIAAPAGGWDGAPAGAPAKKSARVGSITVPR